MQSAITTPILSGQHAFITGGTSGINLGIARRYVEAGAKVTVLGRKPDKAKAAADSLNALARDRALDVTADVRDPVAPSVPPSRPPWRTSGPSTCSWRAPPATSPRRPWR
jgi:NAD(P)-dependent dehydrogenase (short-subunit alcohol dehydrogenase family)